MIAVRYEADEPREERLAEGLDGVYLAVRPSGQEEYTSPTPDEELASLCLDAQVLLTAWHLRDVLRLLDTDIEAARSKLERMVRVMEAVPAARGKGGVVIG